MPLDPNVPDQELTYKIIGAAMRVHVRLGPGLKEEHYHRALAVELQNIGLIIAEEHFVEIHDDNGWLGRLYLDLLVEESVIVEIKAIPHLLTEEEITQVICCLVANGYKVGLLLNFSRKRLGYKRILSPRIVQGWQERHRRFIWGPNELTVLSDIPHAHSLIH